MGERRLAEEILIIMKNLNLLIIIYVAAVMSYSLSGYIKEGTALDFLMQVPRVPIPAWKMPVLVVILYAACLLVMSIQNMNIMGLVAKVGFEIALGFSISYILGFGYTGIVLLILADTMKKFPNSKLRFLFAILISMVYLIMDYDLLSGYFHTVPMTVYLGYYRSDIRSVLQVIKNTSSSLNTFIFLLYIILIIRIQMSETEKMQSLNDRLNLVNEELQNANVRLEAYAKESEKMAQTKERNRLAREIHDTLGHALTGIITGIEACMALMDVAPEATKIQMAAIAEVARQGITDVRRSVNALRPDALEKFSLEEALVNVVEDMRRATGAEIEYRCLAELDRCNSDEEEVIYRIVQESITNAIRHGKASCVWIDINRKFNLLKINIRDNGIGCKDIKKGFGLHHMEERLDMLHGSLWFNGDDGFKIEVEIPLRWGMEEET